MPSVIKICDCFFDIGVYCKKKDPSYKELFSLSMKE